MQKSNTTHTIAAIVFNGDARPIYQTMVEMNCGLQVICVARIPWKEFENEEAVIWYLNEDCHKNQRGILFVKGNGIDDVVDILRKRILNIEDIATIIDEVTSKLLHTLSGKRVMNLYKTMLEICDDLNIECPFLTFVNAMSLDDRKGAYEEWFNEKGEHQGHMVWLVGQGYYYMVHSLAHELRHIYQRQNDEKYYEHRITRDEDVLGYLYSKEEIDADAYGALVTGRLSGRDGMQYVFEDAAEHNLSCWSKLTSLIKVRMDEIRNQENLFGDKQPKTA